jgi:hypothetical protein
MTDCVIEGQVLQLHLVWWLCKYGFRFEVFAFAGNHILHWLLKHALLCVCWLYVNGVEVIKEGLGVFFLKSSRKLRAELVKNIIFLTVSGFCLLLVIISTIKYLNHQIQIVIHEVFDFKLLGFVLFAQMTYEDIFHFIGFSILMFLIRSHCGFHIIDQVNLIDKFHLFCFYFKDCEFDLAAGSFTANLFIYKQKYVAVGADCCDLAVFLHLRLKVICVFKLTIH